MRVYAVKKILQSTPLCYNKPYNKKSGNNRVFPSGHNIRRHPKAVSYTHLPALHFSLNVPERV